MDYCNFAVLSKLPIRRQRVARQVGRARPIIRVRLGPEAGGLTVFGVHTIRFPHSPAQFRQVTEIAKLIETHRRARSW